jgi:hypothetical protein
VLVVLLCRLAFALAVFYPVALALRNASHQLDAVLALLMA